MDLDYKAIGKRIRSARTSSNLTQERLGELADISREHICHIEAGSTMVSLPSLVSIANALETNVDYLLYDNVKASYTKYDLELKLLVEHCTPGELEIIYESVRRLLEVMKK